MDSTSQATNRRKIGLEGNGRSKIPGSESIDFFSRTHLRYVFVGGMFVAGLTWYASSHGLLGSVGEKMNAASRGGSKPPTTAGKGEAPLETATTKPAPQAHGGVAQGVSEGLKAK